MNNVYGPSSAYDVLGAGYVWVYMYGYVWVCMGMYGYIWVCMGMYVCTHNYIFAVLMESVVDLSAGGDPAISGND